MQNLTLISKVSFKKRIDAKLLMIGFYFYFIFVLRRNGRAGRLSQRI
jgi:hypothetical protein